MPAEVRIHHWLQIAGIGMLSVTVTTTATMASRMRMACLGQKARAVLHGWCSTIAIWCDGNGGDGG